MVGRLSHKRITDEDVQRQWCDMPRDIMYKGEKGIAFYSKKRGLTMRSLRTEVIFSAWLGKQPLFQCIKG